MIQMGTRFRKSKINLRINTPITKIIVNIREDKRKRQKKMQQRENLTRYQLINPKGQRKMTLMILILRSTPKTERNSFRIFEMLAEIHTLISSLGLTELISLEKNMMVSALKRVSSLMTQMLH